MCLKFKYFWILSLCIDWNSNIWLFYCFQMFISNKLVNSYTLIQWINKRNQKNQMDLIMFILMRELLISLINLNGYFMVLDHLMVFSVSETLFNWWAVEPKCKHRHVPVSSSNWAESLNSSYAYVLINEWLSWVIASVTSCLRPSPRQARLSEDFWKNDKTWGRNLLFRSHTDQHNMNGGFCVMCHPSVRCMNEKYQKKKSIRNFMNVRDIWHSP